MMINPIPLLAMAGADMNKSNPPHGQTGDGGGQAASGVMSVTSSSTIIGDGGGEKIAGAGLEQISVKSTHGLLVLEDVDEDAEGADATTRDELIMLAHDNLMCMEELRRYLQEEEKLLLHMKYLIYSTRFWALYRIMHQTQR